MDLSWRYNPYALPLFMAVVMAVILAIFGWRRRSTAGAKYFVLLMLAVAHWCLGYALELGAPGLAAKIFWGKVEYLGIVITPVAWALLILHVTHREKWLTRPILALTAVIPLITLLLIWTTEWRGLMWRQVTLDTSGPFPALKISYGPWFWIQWAFATALIFLGSLLLMTMLVRSARLYRWQTGLLLFAALVPWVGNGLYIFRLTPAPNLDLTPLTFTLTGIALGWNLFRFRLLDIIPVAHQVVVEGMSDGVIVLDSHHRVVDVNPAARQVVGRAGTGVVGQTAGQLLSAWPHLLDQLDSETESQCDLSWRPPGQSFRFFDVRISPLYNQQAELTGRLMVMRDITERKQVEAALAQARDEALEASRFKGQLLARVSHELRTPLGAILGYAELLQTGMFGSLSPAQANAAGEIIDSAQYLTGLVNELLDQARLESNRLQLQVGPFELRELVRQVETKMQVLARAKGLDFAAEIAPDMPDVLVGDTSRLQQILVNLAGNAIKFTKSGQVRIRLYVPTAHYWAMQVSDTGPGIPPDAQGYIFEPFRQVDGSITREYAGAGLGLSIVKQLAALMGGQIFLESKVGQGSIFTIWLPVTSPQELP